MGASDCESLIAGVPHPTVWSGSSSRPGHRLLLLAGERFTSNVSQALRLRLCGAFGPEASTCVENQQKVQLSAATDPQEPMGALASCPGVCVSWVRTTGSLDFADDAPRRLIRAKFQISSAC